MQQQKKKETRDITDWPAHKTMEHIKKSAIIHALKFFNGNGTRAAKALNISIKTIRNYKKRYGLYGLNDQDPAWEAKVKEMRKSLHGESE